MIRRPRTIEERKIALISFGVVAVVVNAVATVGHYMGAW